MAIKLSKEEKQDVLDYLKKNRGGLSENEITKRVIRQVSKLKKRKKIKQFEEKMISQIDQLLLLLRIYPSNLEIKITVLQAFNYFIDVNDIVPDYLPLGYLDDAYIIDIVYTKFRRNILKLATN